MIRWPSSSSSVLSTGSVWLACSSRAGPPRSQTPLLESVLVSDFLTDLSDHPCYSAACLESQSHLTPCAQQLQCPACLSPSEVFAPL